MVVAQRPPLDQLRHSRNPTVVHRSFSLYQLCDGNATFSGHRVQEICFPRFFKNAGGAKLPHRFLSYASF